MKTLFDALESAELKEQALLKHDADKPDLLEMARQIARQQAERLGTTDADRVGQAMKHLHGIDSIGPKAGALFRGPEWEFTGQRVLSSRVSNHSREIKVWRLRK